MNALADVSIYVVTNRTPYLKCDLSVSIYVAVAFTPNHPTDPYLREGLSQTMLLVTNRTERRGMFSSLTEPVLELMAGVKVGDWPSFDAAARGQQMTDSNA